MEVGEAPLPWGMKVLLLAFNFCFLLCRLCRTAGRGRKRKLGTLSFLFKTPRIASSRQPLALEG